jgi:hypothetical protein
MISARGFASERGGSCLFAALLLLGACSGAEHASSDLERPQSAAEAEARVDPNERAERMAAEAKRLADESHAAEREAEARRQAEATRAAAEAEAAREARARAEEAERARLEAQRLAFEAAFPLYGVAYHFLARVYERPTYDSKIIGYMRRGSRFRASERVPGRSCARGWYEVPGGGFVCHGEGYKLGRAPQSFEPAPQPPALEDALPYAYAYTPRKAAAQFWRLPTADEETQVAQLFDAMAAARASAMTEGEEVPVEAPPPPGQSTTPDEATDPLDDAEDAVQEAATPTASLPVQATGPAAKPEGPAASGATQASAAPASAPLGLPVDPFALPDFVRMRMHPGFYVSVDRQEADGGRRFVRTVRGAYVRADALIPNEPPSHRGVVLGGSWSLPVAFVHNVGVHRLARDPSTGQLRPNGRFERHTPLIVTESFQRGDATYFVTPRGDVVRETGVRVARPVARPSAVGVDARWIHVDLSEQTLVAYVGDRPVFATTVSTGRSGHETPTGLYRIESKHVSTTMDDLTDDESPYSIEDVPWTMYFEGNFAIHGAFWHDSFGRVRSHGCVNMAPADARWLFQWSEPLLPASWHGVFAHDGHPGTYVYIDA